MENFSELTNSLETVAVEMSQCKSEHLKCIL